MTLAQRLAATLPEGAAPAAQAARERFLAAGLPHARVESWRYSSLRSLDAWDPAAGFVPASDCATLAGIDGTLLQLSQGQLIAGATPTGVRIALELQSAAASGEPLTGSTEPTENDAAQAFRLLLEAGEVPTATVWVDAAISGIWRLALLHDAAGYLPLRLRIQMAPGASITLVEHWSGDTATGLSNLLVQVDLAAGACLNWLRVQELGSKAHLVQRTEISLAEGAALNCVNLELGGQWSRHDLLVDLAGAAAQVQLSGLVALQGRQHHDTQLALTHAVAGANSKTVWKAIANGRARAVFDGLIRVIAGADQTEAHLRTANILLSPHAEIDTKPELAIEADEVVCSHGATVGQLDDRALFYLRSRGIPEAQARRILTLAFGGEVLASVGNAVLREALAERVAAHLPQDLQD